MLLPLFLLFTLMPLLELWLLFQLSGVFGFWTTITVVLLTGMLGAALARWQGWQTMFRIQTDLRAGKMPAQAMGDGVIILVAGVLLITPGVITDVVGLALLLPPVRAGVRKGLQLWLAKHVKLETNAYWQATQQQKSPPVDKNVVEGHVVDAHVVEEQRVPVFDYQFTVNAPLAAVRDFHRDTSALKKLTPPPTIVQLQDIEPLAEGSVSKFTLWVGPLPLRWKAVHRDVTDQGFTDVQAEGPAKQWVHTHTFSALEKNLTEVSEHVEYEHGSGFWGLVTRVLFAKPNLYAMFTYRKFVTRRELRSSAQ